MVERLVMEMQWSLEAMFFERPVMAATAVQALYHE
jgi:hypothetical protein